MRKSLISLFVFPLLVLAGCNEEKLSDWTNPEKLRIQQVLSGATIPYFYIGETYVFDSTIVPFDTTNSISITSESQPADFDIRLYVRGIESAGYTGFSSSDELLIAFHQDIPTIFTAGVFTEAVKKEFKNTITSAIALASALGFLSGISISSDDIFSDDMFPLDSVFIYAVSLVGYGV